MGELGELKVGSGWRYQCRRCGFQVGIASAFPETCSGCHAPGWWGRLVCPNNNRGDSKKDGNHAKTLDDFGKIAENTKIDVKTLSPKTPGGITPQKSILSQKERCPSEALRHYKRGRKLLPTPDKLIRNLNKKGYSSRLIESELDKKGFRIGYKTIQRVLSGQRQGALL